MQDDAEDIGLDIFNNCWGVAENIENTIDYEALPRMNFELFKTLTNQTFNDSTPTNSETSSYSVTDEFDDELFTSVLHHLSPHKCDNFDKWFEIAMITKNEGLNMDIFDKWSQQSKHYNKKDNAKRIRSLKRLHAVKNGGL